MLSIGAMGHSQGHYYINLAQEDYYTAGGEPPGQWRGQGALFLGLTVGATMEGGTFLQPQTLFILVLGAVAFGFSTFGGVVFAKILNVFLPEPSRINPCIGAAGVSAVPMAARVVQDVVTKETDGRVNPLMAAMGPNVAGVIGSAVAAGVFLALLKG